MTASPHVSSSFTLEAPGTRHVVRVEAPFSPKHASPAEPWPALLCLDGDDQFDVLRQERAMAESGRALPPLLLVGVGYGASYREPANRRVRDYTPRPIEGAPDGGGAEAFLEFLVTRLWPELARRYPVSNDIRGIAGHSLGALFALHALFRPRPFFNRVLASAPSIWWGDRAVLAAASALHAEGAPLPARLFLGVGSRDSDSMTGDVDLLAGRLRAAPFAGLELAVETFSGKNHYNSIHPAFRAGLAFLFPPSAPRP